MQAVIKYDYFPYAFISGDGAYQCRPKNGKVAHARYMLCHNYIATNDDLIG